MARTRATPTTARRSARARWSWPATTPARRPAAWPSRPAGRCWPSPPAARAPATHAIRTYRLLLGGRRSASEVERVVVFGHPTLSRPVAAAARPATDVEVWSRPAGPRAGPARTRSTGHVRPRRRSTAADDAGLARRAGATPTRGSAAALDALLAAEPDLTPYDVAGAVARALPPEGLLVVGASSPIRDLDLMVPRYEVGAPPQGDRQPRPVRHRRRRLDRDRRRPRPHVRAAASRCVGDVTFLHDANGLVLGPRRAASPT